MSAAVAWGAVDCPEGREAGASAISLSATAWAAEIAAGIPAGIAAGIGVPVPAGQD